VGRGTGVGAGSGLGVGEGVSPGSASVALLALLKEESADCGIARLITPDRHRVITTKVTIACQLRFSFIVILLIFHKIGFLNFKYRSSPHFIVWIHRESISEVSLPELWQIFQ